ncbi:MAG: SLC45 family MFS transporter, partial [Clostridiaceae bacterium]|nr:SLC45 family MFS transporter [Clostridiaceae bacterium]
MKLDYRKTFFIGFGFLASSLAWSLYNSYVPTMLEERFALSTTVIGTIMTIDNFFGLIFQPAVGVLSDRTHSRFGHRMPWIMVGLPICALLFAFIPRMYVLSGMMAVLIGFNFVMSLWRSPVNALMPNVTPRPLRSKANGVINLMGGIGSIFAFFVGGQLSKIDPTNESSFLMGTIIMLISLFMLTVFIREPSALPRGYK